MMTRRFIAATMLTPLALALPATAADPPPTVEPSTQKFLDFLAANPGPPLYTLSPKDARAVLTSVQSGDHTRFRAQVTDVTWPVGPGPTNKTRVRIVRAPSGDAPLPAVIFAHGGGWVLGDSSTHDVLVRRLSHDAECTVIFVDYDRSPEAHFPVAIEQIYAAAKYASEHAKELNIDASHMAIVGDSVGGNMAAAVTLMAKERKGPQFKAQVLFYPVTDANFETASYNLFADGPWLTKAAMKWFWDAYVPDASARANPLASPLQASLEQLKGLPPALIITDEHDVLRDEGEAYAHKLAQAGVYVVAYRAIGTIHDFVMLNPISESPPTKAAIKQAVDMLKEALSK